MGDFFSSENMAEYMAFIDRHTIMCIVFVAVFVALIYTQARIMIARVKKLNSNLANIMINREDGVYVDVRPANLFSLGHIPGSVNVSLQDIKDGKLQNRVGNSKDKPIVLVGKDKYDSECFNGAVALKKQGYTKVFNLEGGINQWTMDNLPLSNKK